MQHGIGERGARSVVTGEPVAGPLNLTDDELKKNRADCDGDALRHRLIDDYHKARLPKFEDIETPLFSAANWGGMGLHPRGNFEGFLRAGSKQKWLEVHGDTHFTLFYAKYGQDLQRQFFDRFLKGIDNGWEQAAEGDAPDPPSRREIRRRAPRTNGRSRARNGPSSICTPTASSTPRRRRTPRR